LRTKTEAVDLALQSLAGQPMTRDEMLAMEGSSPDHGGKPPSPPRLR
jgi:Arc/MetJ family transcription regulator